MSWKIEGRYFENCPCDAPCPCTASLDLGADVERCTPVLAFHVDSGEIEGVDVAGLTVVAVADTPPRDERGRVAPGGVPRRGRFRRAGREAGRRLRRAAGRPDGGPCPADRRDLGVERSPIEFSSDGGSHSLKVGDAIEVEVDDIVPFGSQSGKPARMVDIFHPASTDMALGKARGSRVNAFGMQFANRPGSSGFSTTFSWAA